MGAIKTMHVVCYAIDAGPDISVSRARGHPDLSCVLFPGKVKGLLMAMARGPGPFQMLPRLWDLATMWARCVTYDPEGEGPGKSGGIRYRLVVSARQARYRPLRPGWCLSAIAVARCRESPRPQGGSAQSPDGWRAEPCSFRWGWMSDGIPHARESRMSS
jgi:hypothetical protein